MRKIYPVIFVLLVCCASASAQDATKVFRGTIDGEIKVQLTLTRAGAQLSGTYFYQNIGRNLRLSGTIDADNNFKLEEFDAKNVKTGEFKGQWRVGDEDIVYLEGNWTSPKSEKVLTFSLGEEMIFFKGETKLINKTFAETNKPRMFEISVDYPEITGVNAATAAKFNKLIKDAAMKEVAEFRKEMLSLTDDELKFFKEIKTNAYLEMGYIVDYASDKVVSIGFGSSVYGGGAHPNHFSFSINFDLASGKKIELADLFKPNSDYLKVVSDYSIKKLKEQQEEMTDEEWIATGAGAKAENFRSWNITKNGILINFDPYQVAAYAAGPQQVLIPFSELKSILRADSVLLSL